MKTTYGKGVGQDNRPIYVGEEYGILSITTFYYDPPTSENYNDHGIKPDRAVELPESAKNKHIFRLTAEEDTQLAAAREEIEAASRAQQELPAA